MNGTTATNMHDFQADPALHDILVERARELATQTSSKTYQALGEEVLTFRLGSGSYSIPAHYIREVQPLATITPLPTTPPFVAGLVNVRGKILTALDIRPLLDVEQQQIASDAFLVVVHVESTDVCLLADSVMEVQRGDSEILPALSSVGGGGAAWVRGLDAHMNVLIDLPQMLADPRVTVQDEVG
jgi:purine-binding chemotaxis protein CheW